MSSILEMAEKMMFSNEPLGPRLTIGPESRKLFSEDVQDTLAEQDLRKLSKEEAQYAIGRAVDTLEAVKYIQNGGDVQTVYIIPEVYVSVNDNQISIVMGECYPRWIEKTIHIAMDEYIDVSKHKDKGAALRCVPLFNDVVSTIDKIVAYKNT